MSHIDFNAGEPKHVKQAIRESKGWDAQRDEFIRYAMAVPDGRRYFFEFLRNCRVFVNCFSANALVMAHNAGEQNVGLRLLADIQRACPDLYLLMMKENDERSNSSSSKSASGPAPINGDAAYGRDAPASLDHDYATDGAAKGA